VKTAQLAYPADAPALTPGQIYSWRVSTAGVLERRQGPVATFFVLAGEDAAQVKAALEKAKLTAPKTATERLAQAHIFEDYGVWYDALRIASELLGENPNDANAKTYYDSLIKKLHDEAEKATTQNSSALPLWKTMQPFLTKQDGAGVRAIIKQNPEAARQLYRELLFENATAKLYENPTLPFSETARKLLAEVDEESRALESHFEKWLPEKKLGVGFTANGAPVEQMIYLAQVANLRSGEKDPGTDAPPGTPRELGERALELADANQIELASASFSLSLAVYALRERRLDDIEAALERAEPISAKWNHPVALFQIPFIRAYAANSAENWKDAATQFARAAELAKASPQLRRWRVNALSMLATVARNTGDKSTVHTALAVAVEEQAQILKETTGEEARLKESKQLANLQTQFGGALAALGRHVEAGEWYVRGEQLQNENYKVEKAQLEKNIADTTASMQKRINESTDEGYKRIAASTLETYIDGMLTYLDSLASARDDHPEIARIAEQRLELARKGGDEDKIAHGLEQVANAYRNAGDYTKARTIADQSLALRLKDPSHRWIYETYFLLAKIADDADDWNEAVKQYRNVIEQTKPGVLPPIHDLASAREDLRPLLQQMNYLDLLNRANKAFDARTMTARILAVRGNYSEADQEYQTILDALPRLYAAGAPDETELTAWINSRGKGAIKTIDVVAHRRQTGFTVDKDEQQRFDLAAMTINAHRAQVMSYRAMLFENENDLEGAVKAYEEANALSSSLVGGAFSLSGTYVALARIERERGNYTAAEPAIEAALAEFVRKNEVWGIASMLAHKSALWRDEGKLADSKKFAEDALQMARSLGQRSQTAAILRTLGRTESDLGGAALKPSEQHLREALAIWRDLGLRGHVAYALDSLGLTLERQGRDDEALAAYIEGVGIIETLVGSLSANVSSETFNASRGNRDLYDHLIRLLIKKGRTAEALAYLERAKSKSLVDALAGANVKANDPKVAALIEQVRRQGDELRIAERELEVELAKPEASRDQAKIAAARAKLDRAQANYLSAVENIKRANPSYASLVAVNPTDLAKIRTQLPEKTLLLEYFPTDTELYIFVVTRDAEPAIRTVPIKREDLAQLVIKYREALDSASEPGVIERSGRGGLWKDDGKADFKANIAPIKDATLRLYDALIAPAQAEIDRAETVILVPAAELYYLPIHALGRATADGSVSFLIEQKRFAYLASADLLNTVSSVSKTTGAQSTRPLLALGNPDGSLPAASEEVSSLGKIFANANVLTGKDATVALVAQSTAGTSYVHFATHGFINSMDPKESYLLLAGDPGRLSVKDLVEDSYKLSFDGTRLVTLSACETNLGGFDPSAVYSSLSRAFAKAGAPTVIASLWSVNDASTKATMEAFYKEIAAGQPKSEALRRAQLAVMHDPRFAHPYFWAPFVVLGDWK
jgi:CHAT domain-containing protein